MSKPIKIGAGLLICGLIAAMMVLSLVPPTDRDGLTHHLYVPKLYLKYGGMIELPAIEFSYYPMNLDLLYIIPLYFGNDILPKFIHMMFGLFSAAFVYRYLSKRISSEMALGGAAFFFIHAGRVPPVHHGICGFGADVFFVCLPVLPV